MQEAEMLRPRVPALEAEVARLQVEVQDRNKGLRDAQNEEGLVRAEVSHLMFPSVPREEKGTNACDVSFGLDGKKDMHCARAIRAA